MLLERAYKFMYISWWKFSTLRCLWEEEEGIRAFRLLESSLTSECIVAVVCFGQVHYRIHYSSGINIVCKKLVKLLNYIGLNWAEHFVYKLCFMAALVAHHSFRRKMAFHFYFYVLIVEMDVTFIWGKDWDENYAMVSGRLITFSCSKHMVISKHCFAYQHLEWV